MINGIYSIVLGAALVRTAVSSGRRWGKRAPSDVTLGPHGVSFLLDGQWRTIAAMDPDAEVEGETGTAEEWGLYCPACGAAVAPVDCPSTTCAFCQGDVPVARELRAQLQAAVHVDSSRQARSRLRPMRGRRPRGAKAGGPTGHATAAARAVGGDLDRGTFGRLRPRGPILRAVRPALPPAHRAALQAYATELRRRFGERLRLVRLFGSWAREQAGADSDVDVAVVVEGLAREERAEVIGAAVDVELEHDVTLSVYVLSGAQFDALLRRERRVARDVMNEGVPL